MVRTINVVYTTRKLSGSEARQLKMYMFLCSYDTVKVGDLIVSPMYTTPMQVIGVSDYSAREQNGMTLKDIIIDSINGVSTKSTTVINSQKSDKMEKKSMFNSFIEKYKSQFIPEKNDNGTLQCLSFSGYSSNRREIKDFMLGQALVRVVVNMFSGMTTGGFNPMMLALADNEDMDMKDLMMIQMMQGNGGSFNPMMLMMMDKGGDNSMFETMMMMQMMGGQNPMMGFMNPAPAEKK